MAYKGILQFFGGKGIGFWKYHFYWQNGIGYSFLQQSQAHLFFDR
jgi:hypothetical protein